MSSHAPTAKRAVVGVADPDRDAIGLTPQREPRCLPAGAGPVPATADGPASPW